MARASRRRREGRRFGEMMYFVYILKSVNKNKFYIGHTQDIEERLERHNEGRVSSTKRYPPWKHIYFEEFKTRAEAVKREKQIKSYKSGEAFKKLISQTISGNSSDG